jgi:hypothetical protein
MGILAAGCALDRDGRYRNRTRPLLNAVQASPYRFIAHAFGFNPLRARSIYVVAQLFYRKDDIFSNRVVEHLLARQRARAL